MKVDASNVRELFDYDPETGVMKRRVRMGIHAAGSICNKVNMYGYISTRFHRVDYLVHRLAWIYVKGDVGEFLIDHKNGIRSDNRIENLRSVDRLFNGQNRKVASKNNKSGFLGVSKCGNKWVSQIQHADRKHHLGLYDTPEEANEVYLLAKEMIHAGYVKTTPTLSPRDTLIEEIAEMVDHMGEGRRLEEYVGAIREMKSGDKGGV